MPGGRHRCCRRCCRRGCRLGPSRLKVLVDRVDHRGGARVQELPQVGAQLHDKGQRHGDRRGPADRVAPRHLGVLGAGGPRATGKQVQDLELCNDDRVEDQQGADDEPRREPAGLDRGLERAVDKRGGKVKRGKVDREQEAEAQRRTDGVPIAGGRHDTDDEQRREREEEEGLLPRDPPQEIAEKDAAHPVLGKEDVEENSRDEASAALDDHGGVPRVGGPKHGDGSEAAARGVKLARHSHQNGQGKGASPAQEKRGREVSPEPHTELRAGVIENIIAGTGVALSKTRRPKFQPGMLYYERYRE